MKRTTMPAMLAAVLMMLVVGATAGYGQEIDRTAAMLLYEQRKSQPAGPFVLNLLLPFGIGSFVQGDNVAGVAVLVTSLVGGGIVYADCASNSPTERCIAGRYEPTALGYIGTGVLVGGYVFGLIRPFTYANQFNEQLRKDLGLELSVHGLGISGRVALR